MASLTATIEVPATQQDPSAFVVVLRITNQTERTIAVLNPDVGVPAPAMNWRWSNAVYQVSLLMSFHYLTMSVTDGADEELPQISIQTWVTPAMGPKLELAPGDSLTLPIPLGSFYELVAGSAYRVALEYGAQDLKVTAQARVTVP
jgi:hypothetical protein